MATTDLRVSWNEAGDPTNAPVDWIRDYGACIAVPLAAAEELFGVLAVYYLQPQTFSDEKTCAWRSRSATRQRWRSRTPGYANR